MIWWMLNLGGLALGKNRKFPKFCCLKYQFFLAEMSSERGKSEVCGLNLIIGCC